MEYSVHTISGNYSQNGSYHQFDLNPDGLRILSALLHDAAALKKTLRLEIGEAILTVSNGSDTGFATSQHESIEWTTNYEDMRRLSVALARIATYGETEQDEIDHVHLEPVYLDASDTVSDIVFQKL